MAKPKQLLPLPSSEPIANDVKAQTAAEVEQDVPEDPDRAEIKALRKARKRKDKTPKELAALKKEEINSRRKKHQIHVQGSDVPPPVET